MADQPPQTFLPPASFFAHHGVWAPGVRLFRRLGFPAKAVLISVVSIAPTLCLLAWQLRSQADRAALELTLSVLSGSLLLTAYLFVCFYRVMSGGLRETSRHLRAMTAGDLTTTPRPWGKDEAAVLMLDLRAMQDSLRGMVLRVREASNSIQSASGEIATSAQEMAMRTESAADSLQRSVGSMNELAHSVNQGAEHTAQAAGVATDNAQIAERGGQVMGEVVRTMDSIREASRRIADITATIDGIAFQTNILALNAAVEAARAGDQGRGFAVVAAEVRTLALRSAEAAREIKTLIGSSVDQVELGARTVNDAGQTIARIVDGSGSVNTLLGEVVADARQQSERLGAVGDAVRAVDQASQQNATLVAQTAGACCTLEMLANDLAQEVARFKTGEPA